MMDNLVPKFTGQKLFSLLYSVLFCLSDCPACCSYTGHKVVISGEADLPFRLVLETLAVRVSSSALTDKSHGSARSLIHFTRFR